MADQTDLRALILETLTTTPSEALHGDPDELDRHASKTGRRHDQHRYHIWCALCQGEADTLADAVVKAIESQFGAYNDWGVRYGATPLGDEEYRQTIAERASEGDARSWRDDYASHGVIVTRTVLVGDWHDADGEA